MMKTICHFIEEDIKIHQGYIYNQMIKITQYRSIIIGTFEYTRSEYELNQYYNIYEIDDLARFFQSQNVIAVHVHHGKHVNKILPICKQYSIPIILSIRGRDGSAKHSSYLRNINRYEELIPYGSLYLPVCQYLADEMKFLGFPPEKIRVLYGGIDLQLFSYQEKTPPSTGEEMRIISVGRLVEKKGFDTLITAFKPIHEQYPNSSLHIIGTGPYENILKELILELQLTNAVHLCGVMKARQIQEELEKAHIFCLASQTALDGDVEGIPNAIKEAMACGLPVVATRHAGIPELIEHQVSGYLVPEANITELTEGLLYMIENPQIWKDVTRNARNVVESRFDMNKQILVQQKYYALLDPKTHTNKQNKMPEL